MEPTNGQTPTTSELHRRQERLDIAVNEHSHRLNIVEERYARIETKVDALSERFQRHADDSDKGMTAIEDKIDRMMGEPKTSSRFEQMWGAMRIVGFILVLIATSSTAVVMLL